MIMQDENTALTYYLVWGQCSGIMRTNVEANKKYVEVSRELGVLGQLSFIKEISYRYEVYKHMAHILYEAHCRFFTLYQVKGATNQDYLERFNTTTAVLDQIRATGMGSDIALTK